MSTDIQVIEKESNSLVSQAQQFIIKTDEQNVKAMGFLKLLKGMQDKVSEAFDTIISKAYAAHKEAKAQKDKYYNPLKEAETLIKSKSRLFLDEQERIRKQEEANILEQQRKDAEKLQKRADKAEEKGQTEKAEVLRQEALQKETITPTVESKVTKVEGVKVSTNWKFRIVDELKLPREYLKPDEVKIGQVVRATKGTLLIAGIETYSEKNIGA